jgi:hypothetical protein
VCKEKRFCAYVYLKMFWTVCPVLKLCAGRDGVKGKVLRNESTFTFVVVGSACLARPEVLGEDGKGLSLGCTTG